MKAAKILKNTGIMLILPVATYLFFFIFTRVLGYDGYGVGSNIQSMMYSAVYSGLVAQAMTINLQTGRFDFALGATLVLSAVVGGNIAKDIGADWFLFFVIVVAVAAVVGLVSGLVYVLLELPPMVVSLGLAMIYEAISFMVNKSKGIRMIGKTAILIWSRWPYGIILMVIVVALLVIVYDYSKIGYNRRALAGGQKIAVDVGIREKKNAVYCYIIAGALMGMAGLVWMSNIGFIEPSTGLASSSYFMNAFLPMFIGSIFGKYSSQPIAVFMGSITQAFIFSALSILRLSNSWQQVIIGVIVCIFLIYSSNSYKLEEAKMFKAKKLAAENAKTLKEYHAQGGISC